jgi:hypothetical protein
LNCNAKKDGRNNKREKAQTFPTLITDKKEYTQEIEGRNNIPLVSGLSQSTYSLTAHFNFV